MEEIYKMIKLKDILTESLSKSDILSIANRVLPLIAKDLGRAKKGMPKLEVHNNVLSYNSGIENYPGDDVENEHAQYTWHNNKIALFSIAMKSEKDIIQAILHEYTHATQDEKKVMAARLDGYGNNPYEKAAKKAESKWKEYV